MAVSVARHTGDGLCWRPGGQGSASERPGARSCESSWVADGHWCRLCCQALRRSGRWTWRGLSADPCCGWRCAAARRLLCAIGGAASIGHIDGAVAAPRHATLPRESICCAGPWAARLGSPQQAGLTAPGPGASSPVMTRAHGAIAMRLTSPDRAPGLSQYCGSQTGTSDQRTAQDRAQRPLKRPM